MHRRIIFLHLISLLMLIGACDDDIPNPPKSNTEFWTCHHEQEWNATQTRDSLIGIWDCIFVAGNPSSSGKDVSNQGIAIEFNVDSSLYVLINDSITQISHWIIINGDDDLYSVEAEPFVEYLGGRIMFCEDLVFFNFSYVDLIDHYFRKRE